VLQNTGITHDCFAATVELRGFADVSDELAKIDAQGLLGFLAAQNVINYRFQEMSKSTVFSTYLSAVDSVSAPSSGIVCWQVSLGEKVAEGQLVGEIVNLEAENPTLGRVPIYSRTEGVLFATAIGKLVCEGENIAKIAGTKEMQNALGADLLTL
jgi:predicted deacylase